MKFHFCPPLLFSSPLCLGRERKKKSFSPFFQGRIKKWGLFFLECEKVGPKVGWMCVRKDFLCNVRSVGPGVEAAALFKQGKLFSSSSSSVRLYESTSILQCTFSHTILCGNSVWEVGGRDGRPCPYSSTGYIVGSMAFDRLGGLK